MKDLIFFSLKRKFFNKTAIILNVLLFLMFGIIFFVDKIVDFIDPSLLNIKTIYVDENIKNELLGYELDDRYVLAKYNDEEIGQNNIYLRKEEKWIVSTQYNLDVVSKSIIENIISYLETSQLIEELDEKSQNQFINYLNNEIEYRNKEENNDINTNIQSLAFMVITSIYFMALSFCGSLSQEIVNEKTSNVLSYILTSIDCKTHFLAKIIVSWLTILIQSLSSLLYIVFFFSLRNINDKGKGLFRLLNYLNLIDNSIVNFSSIKRILLQNKKIYLMMLLILLFLFVGILLIQIIMAIISSFIIKIEESGIIQAPAYLLLMGLYYLALTLNNSYQMKDGIGKILSIIPLFSMIFMPCRIVLNVVSWYEIIVSLIISIISVILIVDIGSNVYELGIKNYDKINFKEIVKFKKLKND